MSKGYQKQGPGKPQGFPGPSSDPRKFSTGARWSLWNGRCETAGAQCAPLRKDRRGHRRGGFQPPPKPSPPGGGRCHGICRDGLGVFLPLSLSQRGSVLRGGTPFGHPSDENGRGQDPPLLKTRAARGKRRAHNAHPYAKTEEVPVGAASSRPKSLPPTGGKVSRHMP